MKSDSPHLYNNITIKGNFLSNNDDYGLGIGNSNLLYVSGNTMNDCGLGLGGSLEELNSLEIDTKNLVNGKKLYFYKNERNLTSNDFINAGQVILVNCNDSMIANLDVSHCSVGISLFFCDSNVISMNTANYNYIGIFLCESNNSEVILNTANYNDAGIYVYKSNYNHISDNTLENNNALGMQIIYSSNNRCMENILNNNRFAIYVILSYTNYFLHNTINYNEFGIELFNSFNSTISDNIIHTNERFGIFIDTCNDINITGNTVSYNEDGIKLYYSNNNNILGNIVLHNTNTGIFINYKSHDNTITANCFIKNNINADCDGSDNYWDDGIKGNYWDDYIGVDTDGDGIGDSSYNISGNAGSQDKFPLMGCPIPIQSGGLLPIGFVILISIISLGSVSVVILLWRKKWT